MQSRSCATDPYPTGDENMLLDTWAFTEIFYGSEAGEKIRKSLPATGVYASVLTLAEIAFWCEREGRDAKEHVDAIRITAAILDVTPENCQEAGKNLVNMRKISPGMGMIDAIIFTQAKANNLEIVTGDSHFKPFPGVRFIGKEK